MLLPRRAGAAARQSASNVVVWYLGGDLSLVGEVMRNRRIQDELPSDHPAALFGQSVPQQRPHEIELFRNARMQSLSTAMSLAREIDSTSHARLRAEAQRTIDELLLPPGDSLEDYQDAAAILRDRGCTEDQIASLAPELGRDLKLVAQEDGRLAQSSEHRFGPARTQVGAYHRIRDRELVETVLESFRQRPLWARVMDAETHRRWRMGVLETHGRGRSRSHRRPGE